MTDAPERIWHSIDRKGKINGSPDAHVKPCEGSLPAYVEYVRADLLPQWQPIETAPKDGTWFLGFEPRKYYEDQYRVWRYVQTNSFVGFEDAADTNDFDEQPTHWMPLPAPPTE